MSAVHVIHENAAWTAPLYAELQRLGVPYEDWHLDDGMIDPLAVPPQGIFYNRMSASSHTRGHRFAPELTRHTLGWLEAHGRRVVNGSGAIRLEIDKLAQYAALEAAGVPTPRTFAAVGREAALKAARALDEAPFILKPNRGGAGRGVQLIDSIDGLAALLDDPSTEPPLDGTWLIQRYVKAAEPAITRCEFIGGEFYYALRVDTSDGFELCPADACALPSGRERFEIIEDFDDVVVDRYRHFLQANGIEVAGIEFVRTADGEVLTYDVNTNTNYNRGAEVRAGVSGMGRLAQFLTRELENGSENMAVA